MEGESILMPRSQAADALAGTFSAVYPIAFSCSVVCGRIQFRTDQAAAG
jgi:hypothetical protein